MAASIAFYSLYSLPPILAIVVWIVGLAIRPEEVQGRLERQITELTGEAGTAQIRDLLQKSQEAKPSWSGRIAGLVLLFFGASGAIGQVQFALNRIWQVQGVRKNLVAGMAIKRLLTIVFILAVSVLLLLSLFVNAMLASVGQRLNNLSGGESGDTLLWLAHSLLSILIVSLIFACLFRFLPDAPIAWSQVTLGSLVTAILFTIGNGVLGWYLSLQDIGSAYGSAGSLAVMLVWVYYSTMIFLFGAELTSETNMTDPAK